MSSPTGFGPHVQQSIQTALEMVRQFRFDEAAVMLFHLNKWHPEEWQYVQDELLKRVDRSVLGMTATVIKCSAGADLSACNALVPGLSQYTASGTNPELLD
jgi:hypothetical protein